jgi:hypothetical protein
VIYVDLATKSVLPAAQNRPSRGVYFVANDAVLDISLAFLSSFRAYNPYIPLCLIPFNEQVGKLVEYRERYRFSIFDDQEKLRRCDEISRPFYGSICGQFRKLCIFEGPFDEFVYVDCDTIILKDLYFTFQFLDNYEFVFSHSDLPDIRKWVWKDSIYETNALGPDQIAFAASTGYLCSSREALTLDEAEAKLPEGLALAPHMELWCSEQPYLNYLVVTSGKRRTSLLNLKNDSMGAHVPTELWAGSKISSHRAPRLGAEDIFMVHWAGLWSATQRDKKIYAALERLGLRPANTTTRLSMPRRRLWQHFRDLAN